MTDAEFIERWNNRPANQSQRAFAREIGLNHRTLERKLARLRRMHWGQLEVAAGTVPQPFKLSGQSVLRKADADGNVQTVMWWDKASRDRAADEASARAIAEGIAEGLRGRGLKTPPPKSYESDLLNIIPYGDPHVGLYAWAQEAGDSFDLDIAERLMVSALKALLERAPKAEEAWLISLGDFFHADDQTNATPAHRHALDVDGRWPKVQRTGAAIMRTLVEMLLERHQRVVVRCVRGNHDPHASFTLAMMLDAWFERDKRVEVDLSPREHWYRQFGSSLYGVTHGHTVRKLESLPLLMATDVPELWAATRFRHWLLGHFHQRKVQVEELSGATVEIFRTLAPADAWAQSRGYRSLRSLDSITVHRTEGPVMRHCVHHTQLTGV